MRSVFGGLLGGVDPTQLVVHLVYGTLFGTDSRVA